MQFEPHGPGCRWHEPSRVVTYDDGTRAVVDGPTDDAMEALISGRLTVVDGWLCLEWSTGSTDLVALPHHARVVTADPLAFAVDDETWRTGEVITTGGGVLDLAGIGPAEAVRDWRGSALVFLQP